MQTTTTKKELVFNLLTALIVIENDTDLNEMFRDSIPNISFNLLRTSAKNGTLSSKVKNAVREIYDRIIVNNSGPRRLYIKAMNNQELHIQPKRPKHYGKLKILSDIANNQTKTELDRAMLALNDLRNVYSKLKSRCIKDKGLEKHILTTTDYRDIVAGVRSLQNKVSEILKKK